jgi:transcriptional regulator with XRE-family HTH domain
MEKTAKRIIDGMELAGLKQADLVEKTGISKGALSSYISGKYEPKQRNIYKIAKALDVNEAWLMGYDVPMNKVNGFEIAVSEDIDNDDKLLTIEELNILDIFNNLNKSGKLKATDYLTDLSENPKYTD